MAERDPSVRTRYLMRLQEERYRDEELGWEEITRALKVPDPRSMTDYEAVENAIVLDGLLSHLSERDRTVLELRFLNDYTLDEVGKVFRVTGEAVRQMEGRALSQMQLLVNERRLK